MGGDRLGGAVSARQVANPLPKDPATPALRDKRLPITRLKLELQNSGDAFVVFQVADPNASPEVEKLRPETQDEFGEGLDGWRVSLLMATSPAGAWIATLPSASVRGA
jgi:hypothetical protein